MLELSSFSDYLISAVVGFVLAILIVACAANSKSESDFGTDRTKENDDSEKIGSCIEDEVNQQRSVFENGGSFKFNADQTASKLAPIQKLLGLSDEQIRTAIDQTNFEMSSDEFQDELKNDASDASQALNEFRANEILDIIVYVGGTILIIYFFNSFSEGDFGRMLAGLFPAEASAIKTMLSHIQRYFFTDGNDSEVDNRWDL